MRTHTGAHERGIALVIAAVAFFAALDTTTKFLSTLVPVAMVMWFRYLFQVVSTVATLGPKRGRALLHTRHPWLQFARGVLLLLCSVLGFLSLKHMPVGEFTAILMLTPLLITLLAARSLGERVSPLRWACVGGGFVGALVVIRPGAADFDWALLMPLALVACNAAFQLLTGRLARTDDAGTMHFYTGCVGVALSSLALPFAWQTLPGPHWAALLLIGVFSTLGHFLLILGYGRAPAATLTPFLYFQIAFAALAGWLVFSHAPDLWSVVGIAVIAVCGAAGTWLSGREQRRVVAVADPSAG
ncbi:DMT family transporter [Caldimonas tepidiphila]|uniref:DMT family transporter n=1 Tax=Caldimonas tepidiphila TaxID=2315841 RepID=UPI000E5B3F74|nr:DMT family transporter [Caldimonas tepidiphila]